MFTGGAAAEIASGQQDTCALETSLVEWVVRILATIVFEGMFAKSVEGHAAQEAGWDDAIGVDVIQQERDCGGGDGANFAGGHGF